LPNKVLIPIALGILVLHPIIDVSSLPIVLRAITYEPVRTGTFRSLYPVVPWIAVVILGFVIGRDALSRQRPERFWAVLSVLSLGAFLAVRLIGGYGNAYPYTSIASMDFWTFAKYPPDLPFLSWSFACIFLSLAVLSIVVRKRVPAVLRPFELFGRVPFFFYIVHFYVLGIAAAVLRVKVGLLETYGIWLVLLLSMALPCTWYYRVKRDRPNFVTRYV
jgi:uncharacterized membrane protein